MRNTDSSEKNNTTDTFPPRKAQIDGALGGDQVKMARLHTAVELGGEVESVLRTGAMRQLSGPEFRVEIQHNG